MTPGSQIHYDFALRTQMDDFGNGRLLAVDLQDLTQPRLIGAMSLPAGQAQLAAAAKGTIPVGNTAIGVMVLEMVREFTMRRPEYKKGQNTQK